VPWPFSERLTPLAAQRSLFAGAGSLADPYQRLQNSMEQRPLDYRASEVFQIEPHMIIHDVCDVFPEGPMGRFA